MEIKDILARWILDSRGTPTVEAEVVLQNGKYGRAAVPSGASTGSHEAHELRDETKAFHGMGVSKAVENITKELLPALKNYPADDQYRIDESMIELDGTPNKSRLGANALLAVSLATAHAAAAARELPLFVHINDIAHNPKMSLPLPMMNVLNGGRHASGSADFQEYMIVPTGAESFPHALQMGAEVFLSLKKRIAEDKVSTTVGDEGGFTYPVSSNTQMLEILTEATESAGYKIGDDINFALDVAASEFYSNNAYVLATENRSLSPEEMIAYLNSICKKYKVISIEDGLSEDSWEDWTNLTTQLGQSIQLVGDDLLVTNQNRLTTAIEKRAGNAILIKPNQIGTLTETLRAVKLAQDNGWRTIMSHRSGETEDVTIAHLAVGLGTGQIKTGSLSRSERTAKYNELMRIASIRPDLELARPFN